jgi:8-oxo-dGTP pyrophosphatase MutT (NUDIX family)
VKRTYRSAGAIVVSADPTDATTLLLEQVRTTGERQVVAPKGTIEAGESPLAAAAREVREEAGLSELTYIGFLGQQRYSFTDQDGEAAEKTVDWFLFATQSQGVAPQTAEGFVAAEWLPLERAIEAASHAGFGQYLERARDIVTWRQPGRLAYSNDLSDIVWHIAQEASDLLGPDANGGLGVCGSAARGDFVDGWSDIDIIGWDIDPTSEAARRISELAARADHDHGIHTSVRLADANGRDASGAGPLYDMKLQAVLNRGAIDVPVIAGTQPLPSYSSIEDRDLVRDIEALRGFAVARLDAEPDTTATRRDRARRVLSVMCSAARNIATTIDADGSLRLPSVVSLLGDRLPGTGAVQLLTNYDRFRRAGANDLDQAEALAERVPASLGELRDLMAGGPVLSTPSATADR